MLMVSLIGVQDLEPSRYQNVMDWYTVGFWHWYYKDPDSIETDLDLIGHRMSLANNLTATYVISTSPVY